MKRTWWAAAGLWAAAQGAAAYQPVSTPWPGSAKGTLKIKGVLPPAPAPVPNDVDPLACGAERPVVFPQAGAEGKLAGALVFLEGIPSGRALPRRQVSVDVRDCSLPALSVLSAGDELQLGTVDSVPHQVRITFEPDGGGPVENWGHLALVPQGQRVRLKLPQPGWVTIRGAGTHAFILGVVRVLEHPYATLSLSDGSYELRDIPAGSHTLRVWHPQLGTQVRTVEVKAGYPTRTDIELDAAEFQLAGVSRPK